MSREYVERLENRLLQGTKLLAAEFVERQRQYVLSKVCPRGGFTGRMGGVDPYYTAFGLRTADLLQIKGDFWQKNGELFFSWQGQMSNIIDCYSMLVQLRVIERNLVERKGKSIKGAVKEFLGTLPQWQGIYEEFLIMLCRGMVGEKTIERTVKENILALQKPDGGFSQSEVKNASLNPTAAAVALLEVTGGFDEEVKARTAKYLSSLQDSNGGFYAHCHAPEPDLLSTFTALVAAISLDCLSLLRLGDIGRFVKGLQASKGGFHGTQKDKEFDLEYTFYGIGTLALLASIVKERKGLTTR